MRKLYMIVNDGGEEIKTLQDLAESFTDNTYTTEQEALDNFEMNNEEYIVEIDVLSVRTDNQFKEVAQNLKEVIIK